MAANAFRSGLRRKAEPLRVRAFRGIFVGAVCSGVTDGIVPVAFAVHSIQEFGSATSLTVILIALWAGRFACTPVAGLAAARRDPFAVMIGSDVVRMVAQGGLALVLVGTGRDSLTAMAVSAALFGAATAFYAPALSTVLPTVVPGPGLRPANALIALVTDISVLIGPAVAVVLSETVGFVWILVFDSVTFGMNLVALVYARRAAHAVLRPDEPADCPRSTLGTGWATLRGTVTGAPWLGWSVALWFAVSFVIGLVAVAGPALTVTATGGGGLWAALATGMAVAALTGSLSVIAGAVRFGWRCGSTVLTTAVVFEAVAVAGYGLDVVGPVLLFIGCLTAGFAISITGVVWQALIQAELPADELGVFGSVEGFAGAAGVPAGMVAGGTAVSTAGTVFVACGAVGALLALTAAVRASMRTSGPSRAAARPGGV
ncbi:MFS transporter [Nocardia sienata]|uniref:MFS transporter n=1 Tax=Nocardia sienata TaxID=248552 RepID=UPI0007A39BFD|nr:MFS transporter [Nocardia sienata]